MQSLFKRHILTLITAATIAIGVIVALWLFARVVERRTNRVISAKEQLASYEENKKIFAEESKLLAAIAERETSLEHYRITPESTPELLSSIESLAATHGVTFSITAVQTPGEGEHQKLIVDFSAEGSRAALDTFIAALSHQTYQVKFDRVSLFAGQSTAPSEGAAGAFGWSVLASIQIVSY